MACVSSPVVVFGYNRKEKLQNCLYSLMECDHSNLTDVYIFSDGSKGIDDEKKVLEVRRFLDDFEKNNCFRSVRIIKRNSNLGLAKSIISGVTDVLTEYDRIIVLEDDLIVAKDFLDYMNEALEFYNDKNNYGSISAYTFPLKELKNYPDSFYTIRKADCWGWGTWKRIWDNADWEVQEFDEYYKNKKQRKEFERLHAGLDEQLVRQHQGELDAWSARWTYYLFKNSLLTIYPTKSKVLNVGLDGSGTNCGDRSDNTVFGDKLSYNENDKYIFKIVPTDKKLEKAVYKYSKRSERGYIYSIFKHVIEKI